MKFTKYTHIPEYVKEKYDAFYILKFFPEKWQRNYFLDGKLYMRSHTEFANSDMGDGRFDITEGAEIAVMQRNEKSFPEVKFIQSDNDEIYVQVIENTEKPENYNPPRFFSYPNKEQRRNIFCMYVLWLNRETGDLRLYDDAMIRNFGEYGIIITDFSAFINRVAIAGNTRHDIEEMHCGFVNYIPKNNEENGTHMNPYLKFANGYYNQSEFRICAETNNKNLLELELDDKLRDISIPINMKTFLSSVKYNNPILSFQDDTEK